MRRRINLSGVRKSLTIRTAYLIYEMCCFFYPMEYVIRNQKTDIRRQKTDIRNQKSDIEAVGCHLPESE